MLRRLQHDRRHAGTGAFDRAVLDAGAGLFDVILDDPGVSQRRRAHFVRLHFPALRVSLVSPVFSSDVQHPARQLIDLMGLFSRCFPEAPRPTKRARASTDHLRSHSPRPRAPGPGICPGARRARRLDGRRKCAHGSRAVRGGGESATDRTAGTRQALALGSLDNLTQRYPAPESVLRRLEAARVPCMTSLYAVESGEGPDWRAACLTMTARPFAGMGRARNPERSLTRNAMPRLKTRLATAQA